MARKINVSVNAKQQIGALPHSWRYIGYDECNYTTMPEGIAQLKKFASLGDAPYWVRTHFMFCNGNGGGVRKFGSTNLYIEDESGEPQFDFTEYDRIIDTILACGCKPYLELGFMPLELADESFLPLGGRHEMSFARYKEEGWACPPKDFSKWYRLIEAVAAHLHERYGEEAEGWYYELWNEPDIFYWYGTTAQFCKLYDYTEAALHAAMPTARLGGPTVTGIIPGRSADKFLRYFLRHCKEGVNFYSGKTGTRLDFVTFHAKGGGFPFSLHPEYDNPSLDKLIRQIDCGAAIAREYGYGDCEIVVSEEDPDGWAAGGIYDNPNMIFRNTEYYASYVAAAYEQTEALAVKYGVPIRPLAWAFVFPDERCFEGTRVFSTQGIDKPVYNSFALLSRLGERRLDLCCNGSCASDDPENAVVGGMATGDEGKVQILLYSHHDDRRFSAESEIALALDGLADGEYSVTHLRIDAEHSNSHSEWQRLGSPLFPDAAQKEKIIARSGPEMLTEPVHLAAKEGKLELNFTMPAHAVSLLEVEKIG